MLDLVFALGLAIAPAVDVADLQIVPPYKIDKHWHYFRNANECTTMAVQPANGEILLMAYNDEDNAFSISFTTKRQADLKQGDQYLFDIRLHRPAGVLDDGWEGVTFTVSMIVGDHVMMTSEWMDVPATRDFAQMDAVEFVGKGRSANYFRMRAPDVAVKEMIRCARGITGKS